jgi:transposase-like protein
MRKTQPAATTGAVYCPACTHTVTARVVSVRRRGFPVSSWTVPGQKCARCQGSLDAAVVLVMDAAQAA